MDGTAEQSVLQPINSPGEFAFGLAKERKANPIIKEFYYKTTPEYRQSLTPEQVKLDIAVLVNALPEETEADRPFCIRRRDGACG